MITDQKSVVFMFDHKNRKKSKITKLRSGELNSVPLNSVPSCAEIKPRFYKLEPQTLIKATQPWERVSTDFKGPITSREFPYMLTVVDEYRRFPFAFPC